VFLSSRKTLKLRQRLVKLFAPKLYVDIVDMANIKRLIDTIPRPMTLFLKERSKNEELVGVEIGVAKGVNALSLLEELSIRKLFLVDPYVPYVDAAQRVSHKDSFIVAWNKLSNFRQVQFIKKTSRDAVKDVGEPLDFVYIDGNHSYEYVKNDIALYYPLVKAGGVIGGHDYVPYHDLGVFQAVNEFVQELGRLGFHAVFPDWWVVK
jgi:hypothetical protein